MTTDAAATGAGKPLPPTVAVLGAGSWGTALAALIAGHEVGGVHAPTLRVRLIAYGCAALVAFFGAAASRSAARSPESSWASRPSPC